MSLFHQDKAKDIRSLVTELKTSQATGTVDNISFKIKQDQFTKVIQLLNEMANAQPTPFDISLQSGNGGTMLCSNHVHGTISGVEHE